MKTRYISWIIPMIGVFGLIASCGDEEEDADNGNVFTNTNTTDDVTDDEDSVGGVDMVQVDVLEFGGFFYPTGLFICGADLTPMGPSGDCTEGTGCVEHHWHSNVTVVAIADNQGSGEPLVETVTDPDTCKCGHGKVSEITRTTTTIAGFELQRYLTARSLIELPDAGPCPP